MQKAENLAKYDRLVVNLAIFFSPNYTPALWGGLDTPALWRGLDDFRVKINGKLLKRARAMAGREGAKDPDQVRRFLDRLAADALEVLEEVGQCETRTAGGKTVYRMSSELLAARAAEGRSSGNQEGPDTAGSHEMTAMAQEVPPASDAAPTPPRVPPDVPASTTGAQTITHLPLTGLKPHPRARQIPKMPPK